MGDQNHRPALTPDVFQRLEIYRAEHSLQNSNEAIEHLLDRIDE